MAPVAGKKPFPIGDPKLLDFGLRERLAAKVNRSGTYLDERGIGSGNLRGLYRLNGSC